jgi:hypothetical protein
MLIHPKDKSFLWPISVSRASASKCPTKAAEAYVTLFQGQNFSLAHFNISKWPPSAVPAHVCLF